MQLKTLDTFRRLWRYLVSTHRGQVIFVVITLAVSLALRVFLFRFQGHPDEGWFTSWYYTAAEHGVRNFYSSIDTPYCDYPPLNIYVFWIFGKLAQAFGPDSLHILLRLPQNLFDLGTALLIFFFVRQRYSYLFALGAMTVYALNPATIFDLAVWGQMDSIYTFFMVGSLYAAMRSKHELSAGLLSLAILTKPQSVILLPVVAYLILRNGGWKRAISSSAVFIILIFVVIAPFSWDNPIAFLIDRYAGYNQFKYTSLNAYNFWALAGMFKDDTVSHLGLSYQMWGIIAFVIFAAFVMWQLHRKPKGRAPIFAAFLLMFGFFMLMTRMHERYLFPVFALLAMAFSPKSSPWVYVGLMATYFFNLAYVLHIRSTDVPIIPDGHWSIYVVVPINAILFFYSIWDFYRMQRAKLPEAVPEAATRAPPEPGLHEMALQEVPSTPAESQEHDEKPPLPTPAKVVTPWSHVLLLALIIATYLGISLWNLGDRNFPKSDLVLNGAPQDVVVDLGKMSRVDSIFLLREDIHEVIDRDSKTCDILVGLSWGSPGNWTPAYTHHMCGDYRKWERIAFGYETRYILLQFSNVYGQMGEIALFSGTQKLAISRVTVDGDEAAGALLMDEQNLVRNPGDPMSGTYFDEIYFVRTAEEHLKLEEPSQWDHPPMSKLIIAASIATFGHNPFAWRIGGVICATLMIPIIYLFARRMFKSSGAGLIAAFLLAFDFMHFVEARIATPETYILFFVLLMFYFFYRYWEDPARGGKYLFLSLVCFGFGFATKWVVMYGFVGIVILLILLKWRKPKIYKGEILWFAGGLATAVAIYMLSYIPYFMAGHGLGDFWTLQLNIFRFHSHLEATHPYASEWYTWPLMTTPVYLAYGRLYDTTSYIATFGNPALWWASIPAMLGTLWLAVRYKHKIAIFIVIGFLAQWLFFIPITRVLFIYHFYPNVLFMVLAITLWSQWLWKRYSWGKWAVAGYLALNVACFAFLFPFISGLPMSDGYWNTLRWLLHWVT